MTVNRSLPGLAIVCLMFVSLAIAGHAAEPAFPRYAQIEPNVAFWTDIYARYTTHQAVVHDSVHLDVVYGVIDLVPADSDGARKINRRRMKAARQRYEGLLKQLAADPETTDGDCRRVAERFRPGAGARTFRHASYRVRCQIGQRDRFRAGLIRSGAYLERIRTILHQHGLPEDLAYLPHVESSFDIRATSKFGAAGIWQFTRSTGRRFLAVDCVRDERRDPVAATHAAACLLKENYEKLGSWPLAITAYNHGAAGMLRARARHGDYPAIFKGYRGRTFKFASRNFYAEFLAARQVASDYRRYFGDLPIDPPVRMRSVRLDAFVDWQDLCRHFELSRPVARALNPALRQTVFSGQKYVPEGYVFNLPVIDAADDGRMLAAIPASLEKSSQRASRFYTVQAGDTASRIARMHRVKLADLVLANNLDRRATIYAHQKLRIPQAGLPAAADGPSHPATLLAATRSTISPAAATVVAASIPVASADRYYRRPGPTPAQLLAMTDSGPDVIDVRPAAIPDPAGSETIAAGIAIDRIVRTAVDPVAVITVEVEETLGHYAEWAGVPAVRLRRLNHLAAGRALDLHQEIRIPLDKVSADRFEARRRAFHRKLQREFFAAHRIDGFQQYRVQPGDSYWSLCREKFDLPLWLLKHYNADVDLADLRIHQALTIPAVLSITHGAGRTGPPDA